MDQFKYQLVSNDIENATTVSWLEACLREYVKHPFIQLYNYGYDDNAWEESRLCVMAASKALHYFKQKSSRTLPDFIENTLVRATNAYLTRSLTVTASDITYDKVCEILKYATYGNADYGIRVDSNAGIAVQRLAEITQENPWPNNITVEGLNLSISGGLTNTFKQVDIENNWVYSMPNQNRLEQIILLNYLNDHRINKDTEYTIYTTMIEQLWNEITIDGIDDTEEELTQSLYEIDTIHTIIHNVSDKYLERIKDGK